MVMKKILSASIVEVQKLPAMPEVASKRGSRSPAPSSYAHPHLTERQQLALALKQSAGSSSAPSASKHSPSGFLRVWMVILVYLVAGTTLPVTIHSRLHGFNPLQAALAFFLVLNVLICFWEISLGIHIMCVQNSLFRNSQPKKRACVCVCVCVSVSVWSFAHVLVCHVFIL
jgi:hypothetical protein